MGGNDRMELSREDLYERVWTTPMMHLAEEFGLSGPGLAMICEKHGIPRPPRGYWAKIRHGQSVRRIPLRKITDEALETVTVTRGVKAGEVPLSSSANRAIAFEQHPENLVSIPDSYDEFLPVVERTHRSLHAARPDERGLVRPRSKNTLDVAIRKVNIDRAMLLMDTLLRAFEERGFPFRVEKRERSRAMSVEIEDEVVEFQLIDVVRKKELALTTEEKRKRSEDQWYYIPNRYQYVPLERLEFRITIYLGRNVRHMWGDGKTRQWEEQLIKS